MFRTKVVQKIKLRILFSVIFDENRTVYEITWKKYGKAGQATDDRIIRRRKNNRNHTRYDLGVVYLLYTFHFKLSFVNCCLVVLLYLCVYCCSCLVCIVVVVVCIVVVDLCVLL